MKKIKNWLAEQSKKSKIIVVVVLILHIGFAVYKTPFYLLSEHGLGAFSGRLLGQLLGVTFPLVLVAAAISLVPYFIFREIAETYKKYLDFFAVVFVIISILLFLLSFSNPILKNF